MNHQFDHLRNTLESHTESADRSITTTILSCLNRSEKRIAEFLVQLVGSELKKG